MTSILARFKRYLGSLFETRGSVLIAEPDAKLARRLHLSLERAGWTTSTTATGAEALALARQSPPDVVVVGEGLADMDWRELLVLLTLRRPEIYTPMLFMYRSDKRNVSREERERRLEELWLKKELAAAAVGDIVGIAQDSNPFELRQWLKVLAPAIGTSWPGAPVDREERVRRLEAFLAKVRSEKRASEK